MSSPVRVERHDDGTATVTIDRPEVGNSLDRPTLTALEAAFSELKEPAGRGELRAVALRGAGERGFSTGYHLPSLVAELAEGESVVDFREHPLERALRALIAIPVPTVALVQGNAYGAGCELALTCDLRLAGPRAKFCLPPARLGILYSATGLRRLVELVGTAKAEELLYTAAVVDAPGALQAGLVNRLEEDVFAAGRALLAQIASHEPLSVRHHKAIFRRVIAPPPVSEAAQEQVAQWRRECFASEEFQRRVAATLAKRKKS